MTSNDLTASDLQERVKLDIIRYANCWEDARRWMRCCDDIDRSRIMNACVYMRNRLDGRQ